MKIFIKFIHNTHYLGSGRGLPLSVFRFIDFVITKLLELEFFDILKSDDSTFYGTQ